MSGLRQGEILLAKELECHKGKLGALEGQQLVMIFLGTCAEGGIPAVSDFMESIGWRQDECYEAAATLGFPPRTVRRTIFRAETPHAAAEAATRFARRQTIETDSNEELNELFLSVVRIGPVLLDGTPHHTRGATILDWKKTGRRTLDEAVAEVEAS